MQEETKSSEESLVPPNIQDDIERLKQIRNQYTKTPEEEEELDNGMHM